ncbi:hypothetical protein GUJ93_ZPchr0006g45393 [Zizania palustris]|uniref:Uncharacterized protein n=1 Tax=Zizania palustris TaxID=103762 RepID=A0A8J5TD39_ZIZPA|nr:hypothetical protein GUJ93_ZPchr0006g45393 [Zizania palustris]
MKAKFHFETLNRFDLFHYPGLYCCFVDLNPQNHFVESSPSASLINIRLMWQSALPCVPVNCMLNHWYFLNGYNVACLSYNLLSGRVCPQLNSRPRHLVTIITLRDGDHFGRRFTHHHLI